MKPLRFFAMPKQYVPCICTASEELILELQQQGLEAYMEAAIAFDNDGYIPVIDTNDVVPCESTTTCEPHDLCEGFNGSVLSLRVRTLPRAREYEVAIAGDWDRPEKCQEVADGCACLGAGRNL